MFADDIAICSDGACGRDRGEVEVCSRVERDESQKKENMNMRGAKVEE